MSLKWVEGQFEVCLAILHVREGVFFVVMLLFNK